MKQIWKKFGLRRPDEMERNILFKAQRNSYIFLVIALVIWSFYESYKVYVYHSRLNPFPCFLLAASVVIQTLSQLIMTRNAVKDDEDSYETEHLVKIIIVICVAVSTIATAVAAIILMGVKV